MARQIVTRDIIHDKTVLHQRGRAYDKDTLLSFVDRWHTVLEESGLKEGDYFMTLDEFSVEMLTLFIAGAERGLVFFNTNKVYLDKDGMLNNPERFDRKAIIFHTEPYELANTLKDSWGERVVLIDNLESYPEGVRPVRDIKETDEVLIAFTSGTTGKPKRVRHTHRGIIGESFLNDKRKFKEGDTYVASNIVHHLGVLVCMSLPAIFSGCNVHLKFASWEDYTNRLLDKRTNCAVLIEDVAMKMVASLVNWDDLDLSHLDRIITGGKVISRSYVEDLIYNKGIRQVINIYGTSECALIASEFITKENIDEVFSGDYPYLSTIVPYVKVKTDESNRILVKSEYISLESSVDENGYMDTGDLGLFKDGKIYVMERGERWDRINDTLINLSMLEIAIHAMKEVKHLSVKNLRLFVEDDDLYLLLDAVSGELDLDKVNEAIRQVSNMSISIKRYGFSSPTVISGGIKEIWNEDSLMCPFE